ncbi:MAG: hypothetical protein C5B56_14055 [Proteobacteria bacterium]|nr:MAG: hypothetical protein C5B56_14055 [Pseudomonadota bacterium]
MTPEITALIWSAVLAWLMLVAASALRAEIWTPEGMRIALGNREHVPPPTPLAGRADRAARNMLESLVLFTAAVVAVAINGSPTETSHLGATLFFWSRLAYWPCYLAGIIYLRTAIWLVSVVGIALVASAVI